MSNEITTKAPSTQRKACGYGEGCRLLAHRRVTGSEEKGAIQRFNDPAVSTAPMDKSNG
jgi:hypothetical protein